MTHTPGKLLVDGGNLLSPDGEHNWIIAKTVSTLCNNATDGFGNAERLALCWNNHEKLLEIVSGFVLNRAAITVVDPEHPIATLLDKLMDMAEAAVKSAEGA